tara:strand:+ start:1154 stop:1954 length:801 start_codon:yes stop_codon:yes gene_type:complete
MADNERRGGPLSNALSLWENHSVNPEDLILADWLSQRAQREGSPLSRLLSLGEKIPAEQATPNWKMKDPRFTPRGWLRSPRWSPPGYLSGQWVTPPEGGRRSFKFAKNPWKGLLGTGWRPELHSIASAKANQFLGPVETIEHKGQQLAAEALNSKARQKALKKLLLRGASKAAGPITGAVSGAMDTGRVLTDPDYPASDYGLDMLENALLLTPKTFPLSLGLAGARYAYPKLKEQFNEAMSGFTSLSPLKQLEALLSIPNRMYGDR